MTHYQQKLCGQEVIKRLMIAPDIRTRHNENVLRKRCYHPISTLLCSSVVELLSHSNCRIFH